MKKENLDLLIVSLPSMQLKGPPMGPALLKGYLRSLNYRVQCRDLNVETFHLLNKDKRYFMAETHQTWCDEEQFEEFYRTCLRGRFQKWAEELVSERPRWIGLSIHWQGTWRASEKMVQLIKSLNPDQKIVIGGPYAKFIYKKFSEQQIIDEYILGEGELRLAELLNDGATKKTDHLSVDMNLNNLPPSDYDDYLAELYPVHHYDPNCSEMGLTHLYVQTSRGCVLNCSFCNIIGNTGRYKVKAGLKVAEEMITYHEKYGVHEFTLADNAINGSVENLKEMASELLRYQKNSDLKQPFRWYSHFILPRNFDERQRDLVSLLGASGCRLLKVGFESGSPSVRKHIGKAYRNEDVLPFLKACKSAGVKVRALFFVGYPTETDNDFQMTLQMVREIKTSGVAEAIHEVCTGHTAMLLPNTRLWNRRPEGLVLDDRFANGTLEKHWKYKDNDLYLRIERHRIFTEWTKELGFRVDDPLEYDSDYLLGL